MPLFYRNLILAFIMLWLPLQGFASTSMPLCQHNEQPAQHSHHDMMDGAHEDHQAHHQHDQHPSKSDLPCDNCSMCHMCSAMALPTALTALNIKPVSFSYTPALTRFSQVFPEQPQRPPLALSI